MHSAVCRTFVWLAVTCLPFFALAESTDNPPNSTTKPLKVLFIGNSYTYVNNLPEMLQTLAESSGSPRSIQTKTVAVPGGTLQMLWEQGTAREAIQAQKWDYVVLQEQSILPTQYPELMYQYARLFDAEIKKRDARTILFLTWARRGYPEMQALLDHAYITLAKELDAQIAPVGPAWQTALRLDPKIPLHMNDGSHPTFTGTYLASCVFYAILQGNQRPCPTIGRPEVSRNHAIIARLAASQTSGSPR